MPDTDNNSSDWDDVTPESAPAGKKKKKRSYNVKPSLEQKKNRTNARRRRTGKGSRKVHHAMTDIRWKHYVSNIANGMKPKIAREVAKVSRQGIESYIVTHSNALKQLREAEMIWLRRRWSLEVLDQMFTEISTGRTVKSVCEEMNMTSVQVSEFYKLMRRDPNLREQYDIARELQAESWMDDTIDIADESKSDRYVDHRGMHRVDHEAIQRSKLRVDTRQWTMGVLNRKRFGDRKYLDVEGNIAVNHAVVLGAARKRLEAARASTQSDNDKNTSSGQKQGREVIEGEYSQSE